MFILYIRIKQRRKELGLKQDQLADRVGYTDRSMISHVEAGRVDLTRTMIWKFAEALETTPEWLMGWDDPVTVITDYFKSNGASQESAEKRANATSVLAGLSDDDADRFIGFIDLIKSRR